MESSLKAEIEKLRLDVGDASSAREIARRALAERQEETTSAAVQLSVERHQLGEAAHALQKLLEGAAAAFGVLCSWPRQTKCAFSLSKGSERCGWAAARVGAHVWSAHGCAQRHKCFASKAA